MKLTRLAIAAAAALSVATPALADLVFPSLSYRTGPYGANGIPFADGYQDYFTMVNARDGGIGGVMAKVIECETGYNTEKGVECYEATKGEGALVYQPLSTGITYQLIPKATADGIPVHSMGYGRTSAKNGKVFSNIFNYPANYWDGASVAINHLLDENGGDLSGKTVALVYHNSAYGKEPIRTLEELSKKHSFTLSTLAVDHPGQEQKSQWLQIRREKPDYVLMWGWGVMNQVPVFADIQKHVVDAGNAAGAGDQIGTVLYNRGMYAAMLAVEAAKTAQEIHGVAEINAAQMRDGMEALVMDAAKMESLGMGGFGPEFAVSCDNHGGGGLGTVTQWDATTASWSQITDYIASDGEVINALIMEDSAAFAAENNISERCN